MQTTIDKAGRLVIPAALRLRYGLKPGTELELVAEDSGIRLMRKVSRPRLVKVGKLLIARPTVATKDVPPIDVAELIDEERERWPL